MEQHKFKPLLKFSNYFIHHHGYVFKITNGKEEILPLKQTKRSRVVQVTIGDKSYVLLHLMIQHFIGDISVTDRVKFKISKDLRICLSSIIIKKAIGSNILTPENEAKLFNYKCDLKANSANSRCQEKITAVDVFRVLCIYSFKCVYCGIQLTPQNWHLDHFTAVAKNGHNILENIVPSCNICNIMKGALDGYQFYNMARMISENSVFKDCIEDLKIKNRYHENSKHQYKNTTK